MPQYEGLALKHILGFLDNGKSETYRYLPDQQELHKVAKAWICNVLATRLKGIFLGWVKNQIEARNEKMAVQKDLMICLDQEIFDAFRSSTKTSGWFKFHSLY